MTDYAAIDRALVAFLPAHGLSVLTEDREVPVRVVPVIDDAGVAFDIWFEPRGDEVLIHVSAQSGSPASVSRAFAAAMLAQGLDWAWDTVASWIRELGHTRTPYLHGRRLSAADVT